MEQATRSALGRKMKMCFLMTSDGIESREVLANTYGCMIIRSLVFFSHLSAALCKEIVYLYYNRQFSADFRRFLFFKITPGHTSVEVNAP